MTDDAGSAGRPASQLRRRRVAAERRPARRTRSATRGGPSEVVGEFPASGEADVDAAVAAAAAAFPDWAALPAARARRVSERPPTRSRRASSRSRRT